MTQETYTKLFKKSKEYMETDRLYHDMAHINNVLKNARFLLGKVGGDEDIVITALLFHDIRRDTENHEKIGADETRAILHELTNFSDSKIEEICLAIERHEKGQITQNEKVIADADKIDAFHITGIGRGFMMLSKKGMILKQAIQSYLDLLEKWYVEFHFDESREIAKADFARVKALLTEMLESY